MPGLDFFVLAVGAVAIAAVARRLGLPVPIVLVVAGLGASFAPGVPDYALNSELILLVFLPPLLYSATLDSSYLGLRANARQVGLLSVGLVLFTTAGVGLAVHAMIPSLPLAVTFALGAIVAPPDALSAVAIARRLGLPRRLVTILVGESLFNDATALTIYRVAVAAAAGEGVSLLTGIGEFALAAVGGVVVGLVMGPLIHLLRRHLHDPLVESAVSVLVPFAAYLVAESFEASGVLAVVVLGLYLGHRSGEVGYATRLEDHAVWKMVVFLMESMVFALIGLQLRPILHGLSGYGWQQLALYGLAVFGMVVALRFVWVFPAAYLPRLLNRTIREREPWSARQTVAVSWAGMRGVVSLAAAVAIPVTTDAGGPFPGRDLLLFLTFCAVLGTLLVQGLSFPALIRALRIGSADKEQYKDTLAEAQAQYEAARAAASVLDDLAEGRDGVVPPPDHVTDWLRGQSEFRVNSVWERLGGGTGPGGEETPSAAHRRARLAMLNAERATFVRMRDERRIDDEVMRRVLHELDLEEAQLARE